MAEDILMTRFFIFSSHHFNWPSKLWIIFVVKTVLSSLRHQCQTMNNTSRLRKNNCRCFLIVGDLNRIHSGLTNPMLQGRYWERQDLIDFLLRSLILCNETSHTTEQYVDILTQRLRLFYEQDTQGQLTSGKVRIHGFEHSQHDAFFEAIHVMVTENGGPYIPRSSIISNSQAN